MHLLDLVDQLNREIRFDPSLYVTLDAVTRDRISREYRLWLSRVVEAQQEAMAERED
jgi:hypothetical protein